MKLVVQGMPLLEVMSMKHVLTAVVVAGLALAGTASAVAGHKPAHPHRSAKALEVLKGKTLVCHRGHTIRVGNGAVTAHVRHGDVVGRCGGLAFPARFALLRADLAPVAGATGSGTARVGIAAFRKGTVLCYAVRTTGVAATAAHVHTAVTQTIGNTSFAANAIVVPLKTPNTKGVARGCMVVPRTTARAILANPASFFVNVHSAAFPNGQVQGTLVRVR